MEIRAATQLKPLAQPTFINRTAKNTKARVCGLFYKSNLLNLINPFTIIPNYGHKKTATSAVFLAEPRRITNQLRFQLVGLFGLA